ncbi:uncharacterized protein LOC113358153 [Papaver somniferum]|uniref:uncharacterized protein LOC113358153 n=1 Tax=Papaver somniferum TaxID=3469 RepID=UPI000E703916|nr:uncharacterized protein LOC113358153 [Papaver somniferum]
MEDRETVLLIESLIQPYSIPQCRICHEEEELGCSKKLEAPCACSGTCKYAHRECIQRWCDEKGNIICEICLQKFQPGYTAPPQPAKPNDIAVTIRDSLEVPIQNQPLHNPGLMAIVAVDNELSGCSSIAERSASCFRFIAITFTFLLLARHLLAVLTSETDDYAFTLVTVLILRACGILIPLYIMVRVIESVQNRLQELHQDDDEECNETTSIRERDVEENGTQNPVVQIQS